MKKRKYILFVTISLFVFLYVGCDDKKDKSYLTEWIGDYEGTSHHWSSYPAEIDGQLQLVSCNSYKDVAVSVSMGTQDSCLYFEINYNDSVFDTKEDLFFTTSGTYFSQWGVGSGYGSLSISFESGSLYYNYFQKCGIPCSSGMDFILTKNN